MCPHDSLKDLFKTMNHRLLFLPTLLSLAILATTLSACDVFGDLTNNDEPTSEGESLFPVRIDGDWGYVNENGRIRIEPDFNSASLFSEGLARVREGSVGYINTEGDFVIEPRFQNARSFSEDLAAVEVDGRWGYVNKSGAFVINPQFQEAHNFIDGRAFVLTSGFDWQYIDATGQFIRTVDTPDLDDFDNPVENQYSSGLALVFNDDTNQYGYIDRDGNMSIDFQFSEARAFRDGYAAIKVSDRWGFIDTRGNITIQPRYIEAGNFGNGLVPIRENTNDWGYADRRGNVVIEPQFEEAREFSEGRAAVLVNGFWGFIDTSGNVLGKPDYDEVSPFYRGAAQVIVEKLDPNNENNRLTTWGYVGMDGRLIWYPTR